MPPVPAAENVTTLPTAPGSLAASVTVVPDQNAAAPVAGLLPFALIAAARFCATEPVESPETAVYVVVNDAPILGAIVTDAWSPTLGVPEKFAAPVACVACPTARAYPRIKLASLPRR